MQAETSSEYKLVCVRGGREMQPGYDLTKRLVIEKIEPPSEEHPSGQLFARDTKNQKVELVDPAKFDLAFVRTPEEQLTAYLQSVADRAVRDTQQAVFEYVHHTELDTGEQHPRMLLTIRCLNEVKALMSLPDDRKP